MNKIITPYNMNASSLNQLSKPQLIKLLLQQNAEPELRKPIPTPRKSVKQMIQDYEDNIILPPLAYRDDYKPIPKPRTRKPVPLPRTYKPIPKPRTRKPVPLPRTKIEQVNKGYTKSFEICIKNQKAPLAQMQKTRKAIEYHINNMLPSMKGVKYIETLKVTFNKMSDDEIVFKTAYFNSMAQTIINQIETHEALQISKQRILKLIAQWVSEGSGWTIESIGNHYLSVVKYQPLRDSSYINLPPELRKSAKGLINLKNNDNECFRWCHIRHLNPQEKNPQRIKKSDKEYIFKNLDYSGIEFPVTNRHINKIEKKNNIRIMWW